MSVKMNRTAVSSEQPGAAQLFALSPAVRRYRDLVFVNAVRSLKVRYRGSFLGIYWSLSNPILMTLVYTTIFGSAFASYYGGSLLQYVLSCFTGLVILNFFSGSTSMALPTIVGNSGLLNKIALPPSVFPVSMIAAQTFQLCIGALPLLAIVTLVTSGNAVNVLALFIPLAGMVLLSLGFALAVSALFAYFRDLPYMYELVVFAMWITSPIFYPSAFVPERVRVYLQFNPLATIIESVRQIALSGTRPSLHLMAASLFAGALAFVVGASIFFCLRKRLMDLI